VVPHLNPLTEKRMREMVEEVVVKKPKKRRKSK
jgi:hypothetical protein